MVSILLHPRMFCAIDSLRERPQFTSASHDIESNEEWKEWQQ